MAAPGWWKRCETRGGMVLLNDRVSQFPAPFALRASLLRTPREPAAAARAFLHREGDPRYADALPAKLGSPPATDDKRAAQADSSRGPDESWRAVASAEAR